jgi:hypothetical protein
MKFLGYMEHIGHCFCHVLLDIYTHNVSMFYYHCSAAPERRHVQDSLFFLQ